MRRFSLAAFWRWIVMIFAIFVLVSGWASAKERPLLNLLKKEWREYRYPGLQEKKLTVDGHERRYLLFVPPGVQAGGASLPLVLALHGGGGEMWGFSRFVDFHGLAASEGFLVAYPNALDKNWSDGRTETLKGLEYLAKVDDVKFLTGVIDDIASACPVDSRRVFATGASNGGFMSQYLAIKASDRIAAIGAVIAGLPDSVAASFSPTLPVAVMLINGDEDPLVPYAGGEVHFYKTKRGRTIGVESVAAKWVAFDGCAPTPAVASLPDLAPDDGCKVEKRIWSGGKASTEVVLLKITGGGHTWPGGSQYLPELMIGRTCRDFSATRMIWDFLRAHPRPMPGR